MQYEHYLKSMFEPQTVAVIGASERADSIGAVLMRNMLDARFTGSLHAINPKHESVFGVPCVARVGVLQGSRVQPREVSPRPGLVLDEHGQVQRVAQIRIVRTVHRIQARVDHRLGFAIAGQGLRRTLARRRHGVAEQPNGRGLSGGDSTGD